MIIINDNDTCKICGAYFQNTGYCTNGHLRLTPENIKKYYKQIDKYSIKNSVYTIWSNGKYAVTLHEGDRDLVSVFSLEKMEYLWLDEKTKQGLDILLGRGTLCLTIF